MGKFSFLFLLQISFSEQYLHKNVYMSACSVLPCCPVFFKFGIRQKVYVMLLDIICRSDGIVRSRIQAAEFNLVLVLSYFTKINNTVGSSNAIQTLRGQWGTFLQLSIANTKYSQFTTGL